MIPFDFLWIRFLEYRDGLNSSTSDIVEASSAKTRKP